MIVKPAVVEAQLDVVGDPTETTCDGYLPEPVLGGTKEGAASQQPSDATRSVRKHRFSGTVAVRDPRRSIPELNAIAQEIIAQFASNTEVSLEVEVSIVARHRGEGFDDATVRNVSENARTLRFRDHDWDDE